MKPVGLTWGRASSTYLQRLVGGGLKDVDVRTKIVDWDDITSYVVLEIEEDGEVVDVATRLESQAWHSVYSSVNLIIEI